MQYSQVGTIESDVVNKFAEFSTVDMTHGVGQVRPAAGAIGATVVMFEVSTQDSGPGFTERSSGNRITGTGLSTAVDLLGIRRVRATIQTASGVAGSLIEIGFCVQNPNVR